jgi:hypothetical protein
VQSFQGAFYQGHARIEGLDFHKSGSKLNILKKGDVSIKKHDDGPFLEIRPSIAE